MTRFIVKFSAVVLDDKFRETPVVGERTVVAADAVTATEIVTTELRDEGYHSLTIKGARDEAE